MFFKKRRVLLVILVALIAVAVYLNVSYTEDGGIFDITQKVSTGKNLGEATLVDKNTTTTDNATASSDYFAQSRLTRNKTRDESVSLLKGIVDNQNSTTEQKTKATNDLMSIATASSKEAAVENLIKAKGFSDCVAFISSDGINVVIKSNGLLANQVAQIKDIIINELKISADKIKIVEIK
jgi:stage III sporulation protein AH